MAIVDRIKCDFPSTETLVAKYPKDNITMGAQLIVNESQRAVFFKGGQSLDTFGPGTHTLSTKNLPILQKLVNLPFGGQTPFTAEIFFVNEVAKLDYKWGTRTPIPIEDPKYQVLISVGCFGQFGLRISDAQVFVTQIVGTLPNWDGAGVLDYFRGVILTRVKDTVARFTLQKNISVSSVTAYLDELSQQVEDRIRGEFAKYGLELLKFFISSITIPDEELKRIQKGAFERLEIDQLGDDRYQKKRSFDVMETAANNPGASGTLMAAGIGLGIGGQMASTVSQMAQKTTQPTVQPETITSPALTCPSCKAKVASNAKFCEQCGTKITQTPFCSNCGAQNTAGSKFCSQCGKQLA